MFKAYAAGNRYPEAVKAFIEAARLQPQSGQVYENLGVAYIKLGQWREARGSVGADRCQSSVNGMKGDVVDGVDVL